MDVDSGFTVALEAIIFPGFHVYVVAPDAVKFTLLPEHTVAGLAVSVVGGAKLKLIKRVIGKQPPGGFITKV
jgi:hypothetical protein